MNSNHAIKRVGVLVLQSHWRSQVRMASSFSSLLSSRTPYLSLHVHDTSLSSDRNGAVPTFKQEYYKSYCLQVTRSVSSSSSVVDAGDKLTLYQYAICPFCNKAKALLSYLNIPYETIEVNPLTKREVKWSKDYQKVPILKLESTSTDGEESSFEQWNGSDLIYEKLSQIQVPIERALEEKWKTTDGPAMTHAFFWKSPSAMQWMEFSNDELAPLLYPNMCSSLGKSFQAFDYVHGSHIPFSTVQKYSIQFLGSLAMYMAASKVKQRKQITDERAALDDALKHMDEKGLQSSKDDNNTVGFLSGKPHPHVGDLAVYGTLRGLEGMAIHQEIMERHPRVAMWYNQMSQTVYA